jgi:hypothetical protein
MVMTRRLAAILWVLACLCVCSSALAQPEESTSNASLAPDQQRLVLEEALALYEEGIGLRTRNAALARSKFLESADRFDLLLNTGVENGQLYFNLANAQLQAGEIGSAVLNYRRAQQYLPGDPRIESNLEYARSQVRSRIPASGSRAVVNALLVAVGVVPWPWRLGGALTLYLLTWFLATVRIFRRRAVPRSLVWGCGLCALLLGVTVVAPPIMQQMEQQGVIVDNDVIVRMGNGEGYDPQFAEPIHEGVEFSVLERRGEWLEIELPNGGRGWIRADQAEII